MEGKIEIHQYKKIFENIKKEVLKSQYKAMQIVNTEMIYMYWNIGRIISENISWGNKFVDNLSIDLKREFPNIQGFSVRNLRNMRKFYEEYHEIEILQTLSAKLTWSHNVLLINKIKDREIRKWYMKETVKNGWSHDMLADQIKYKLYERQAIANKITNFQNRHITWWTKWFSNANNEGYIYIWFYYFKRTGQRKTNRGGNDWKN